MIEFKYSKTKDKECWDRVIQAGTMFNHEFPKTYVITQKKADEATKACKKFQQYWDSYTHYYFREGIKKIYKHDFPDKMICYVNTSPYSMDADDYISVSMTRNTYTKFISTVIHEACHYVFRKYYEDQIKDFENVKEHITVINNDVFPDVKDYGWKAHLKKRQKIMKIWKKTYNINDII